MSNNFTYLLTRWSRVILEKLNGSQLFTKFPAFPGPRRIITVFTVSILSQMNEFLVGRFQGRNYSGELGVGWGILLK
jgi:hypothetical protein